MKLKIIKKKVSSLKELGSEDIEIQDVSSFYDLLVEVSRYEFRLQHNMSEHILSQRQIDDLSYLGKITLGDKYNQEDGDFSKAVETMIQDYKDGIIRVFFNGKECLELDEKLEIKEENEVVFIRLVMLAGRLW